MHNHEGTDNFKIQQSKGEHLQMNEKIPLTTYPQGWEEVKKMIDFTDDPKVKEAFMRGLANSFLRT